MNACFEKIADHLIAVAAADGDLHYPPWPMIWPAPVGADFDWNSWPTDPAAIDALPSGEFSAAATRALKQFTMALVVALERQPPGFDARYVTDFIGTPYWDRLFHSANNALAQLYPEAIAA